MEVPPETMRVATLSLLVSLMTSPTTMALASKEIERHEVDIRNIEDEITIKLVQRKKINLFLFVSRFLDELQLDLHHVAGGHIGNSYSFLFNTKIYEGSCLYASAIAGKFIEVLDGQYSAVPPTDS